MASLFTGGRFGQGTDLVAFGPVRDGGATRESPGEAGGQAAADVRTGGMPVRDATANFGGGLGDGKLTVLMYETLSHTSFRDEFTETATLPSRMLYSVPNNFTIPRLDRSDIGTPSYTRAPGEAASTFALEIAVDEMAYALKIGAVEFRLTNYGEPDEGTGLPCSSKSLRQC